MRPPRIAGLVAALGCLALAALAPAAGCSGTGTTPICNFPDGADNPESGCGELVEAAAPADAQTPADVLSDTAAPDSPVANPDASDATAPDAHVPDAGPDSGPDAGDAQVGDAHADAKG